MKIVILLGDGMGDYPVEELGGKTPLQAARIPNIRRIAAAGTVKLIQTAPDGMYPGSDVANLSVLGYNPAENYTGRAPIEAAGAGIPLASDDVAYRCNLVTVKDGRMHDYSAGHITTEEAAPLIAAVDAELGREGLKFHAGVSYRHLIVWRKGPVQVECRPPHDISGQPIEPNLPVGERQDELRALMDASRPILARHPVNEARIKAGKSPATQVWLWGQGKAIRLRTYQELYRLRGGVISAVDLVRGLGVLAGLEAPRIPGATGFLDTDFEAKVATALKMLERGDFVFLHLEAPDECGHIGDAKKKVKAIELFDERIVGPIWRALEGRGEPYRLVVGPDHRTPVSVRGHTAEPVPMAILEGPVGKVEAEAQYDEFVNNGQPQGMAYDVIREVLRAPQGGAIGR